MSSVVYTFAAILGGYLAATFLGSALYRRWPRRAGGDPRRVGSAYALNVLGCIVGPLLAGFGLLPWLGEGGALAGLAVLLVGAGAAGASRADPREPRRAGALWLLGAGGLVVLALSTSRSFESMAPQAVVRRDATAAVAAYGEGMGRGILVNGIGITHLTPITKMMAHLPLAFRAEPARSALILCFGMGTSYRSSLSWGIRTTAVELVPSVPPLFGFFHEDAETLLASPFGRIVVDDGRRFVERSSEVYDIVIVDPPPPVQAAGSSLLYSREFYELLRRRLDSRGIVQQWIPGGEPIVVASLIKAVMETFPHVRGFRSVEGWGYHLLASAAPIPPLSAEALAARLPERAARDLTEWGPYPTAVEQFAAVLSRELPLAEIVPPAVPALTDDRPLNEYYFLRLKLGL